MKKTIDTQEALLSVKNMFMSAKPDGLTPAEEDCWEHGFKACQARVIRTIESLAADWRK